MPESDAWSVALTFCEFMVLVLHVLVGQLGSTRTLALTFCEFIVMVLHGLVGQLGSARALAMTVKHSYRQIH